jgi:hypothetical protein
MQVNDDTNLPDDGNLCTTDVCTNGTPSNPAEPTTTACGTNQHCDGAGQCAGCSVPSDCGTNPCLIYSCSNNACGSTATALGTVVATQTAHDCKQDQCDGNGHVVSVNLDTDTPADDGNVCTVEGCSNGAGTSTPAPTTTACSTSGGTHCNGAGMCVAPPPPAQTFMVLRVDVTGLAAAAAAPLFVEERSVTDGSLVRSISLPTFANPGTNKPVMLSSTAKSEGGLSLSVDGHYLMLGGYGPTSSAQLASVGGSAADRVVARINVTGTVETYALTSTAFLQDNFRAVVSTDGADLWASGAAMKDSGDGGVWYAKFGSNSGVHVIGDTNLLPKPPAYMRVCTVADIDGDNTKKLYCSCDRSNFTGILLIGNGVPPQAPMQSANLLPGMLNMGSLSPYAFVFVGTDTLYVADDNTPGAAGGGVQKWIKANGTWSSNSADTLKTGAFGAHGLSVLTSGSTRIILATTADVDSNGNAIANSIVKFVDTGSGTPTTTTLVSVTANSVFKGLALPPN